MEINISDKSIGYLKDMIKIKSLSRSEIELSQYISKVLKEIGLEVLHQPVTKNSENIIAKIEGTGPGPNIILAGHMDTVPPTEGWNTDPFDPVEENDRLYGLGSADMKAGLAAILALAETFNKLRDKMKGNLIFLFVSDEEGFSTGINKYLEDQIEADCAFMFEPHFDHAIIGAVGKILINANVKGKASHAAFYHEGINAISEAGKFINLLDGVELKSHERIEKQPYLPFNIKGGYETYSVTIPDSCQITLNKHTVPGETKELVLDQLQSLIEGSSLRGEFSFEIVDPYYPSYEIDTQFEYLTKLKEIYEESIGKPLDLRYLTGVSDSNCLVGLQNIPTINFGPSGGPIHQPNEWVSLDEFKKVITIYSKLLEHYLL